MIRLTHVGYAVLLTAVLSDVTFAQKKKPRSDLPPTVTQVIEIDVIRSVTIDQPRSKGSPGLSATGIPAYTGDQEVTGSVTLVKPAPSGGLLIAMSSSNPTIAPVPPLRIDAGATVGRFTVRTKPVAVETRIEITAKYAVDTEAAAFLVLPPTVKSLMLAPQATQGGNTVVGTLHFTGPTASGTIVATLQTDTNVLPVPAIVTLPSGRTAVEFNIATKAVAQQTVGKVTASYAGKSVSDDVTIKPPELKNLNWCDPPCQGLSVPTPISTQVSAVLTGAAPPGGLPVKLTSSNPSIYTPPATVTVPAGANHVKFPLVLEMQPAETIVYLTGELGATTKDLDLHIYPPNLVPQKIEFFDRNGNLITRPPDSQPFNMCATIRLFRGIGSSPPLPTSMLFVNYRKSTGVGREMNMPVSSFAEVPGPAARVCTQVSGLESGESMDVEVRADETKVIPESSENDNRLTARISR